MVQIYYGNGKGKTTAAAGLSLRAAARGWQVLFVQFLKDGASGEVQCFQHIPGIDVATQRGVYPFFSQMTEAQKEMARKEYQELLEKSYSFVHNGETGGRLLVLDEVLHALRYGLIEEDEVLRILDYSGPKTEIVLTGYDPSEKILGRADYITQMKKERHPFDEGMNCRIGIEE